MIGIYGIFRKSDDKCMYVGQSKDINERIKYHLKGFSPNNFNEAEYYGELIEQHFINDKTFRLQRETYWIKELNPEFNKAGKIDYTVWNKGLSHSEETKKKISINHADVSGENNPMSGKHHTEESNEKNRQAHLGEKNPCYRTKWINNGEITKHVKEEELDKYINDGWNIGRLKYNRIIRRK